MNKFDEDVRTVRKWIYSLIDPDTLHMPSEDDVWEFITTYWKNSMTDYAEKLLCESMKNMPYSAYNGKS